MSHDKRLAIAPWTAPSQRRRRAKKTKQFDGAATGKGEDLGSRRFRCGLPIVAKPPSLILAVFSWDRKDETRAEKAVVMHVMVEEVGKEGGAVEVNVGSAIHPKSIWTLDSVSLWRTLHSNTITASDPNLKPSQAAESRHYSFFSYSDCE
ncbi:hypothetical protein Ahy_A06g027494 isoform A [Arachis hypogaea]|uniref:Uncharacterized protein n=1 Tax=Arachis hypogaea TaxID=3818 RepID=A0A445CNV0_ARAHY|nr:hypothetical protein Ahy_A06g027494 isoform A [Arachis hypogaea]